MSVQTWAESLTRWTIELGFDTFIFWPLAPSPEQFRRFALDVAPRTRELVARARQEAQR